MKKTIKWIYKVFRSIVVTLIAIAIGLFAALYIAVSLPQVQNLLKEKGEKELSELLKTNVTISDISIQPFNQLVLHDVNIPDQQGDSLIFISDLGAGIRLYNLVAKQRLVFTFAEVIGLKAQLKKASPTAESNFQFLIDAFAPKENQPKKEYDIKIFNVVIRKSDISYDILDQPLTPGRFNPRHISIHNLKADVALPRLRNGEFMVEVKRLTFDEESDFHLKNFRADVHIDQEHIAVSDMVMELPGTLISPDDFSIEFSNLNNIKNEIFDTHLDLNFAENRITPADLKCFLPALGNLNIPVSFSANMIGSLQDLHITNFLAKTSQGEFMLSTKGMISNLRDKTSLSYGFVDIILNSSPQFTSVLLSEIGSVPPPINEIATICGDIGFKGNVKGSMNNVKVDGTLSTSLGTLELNTDISHTAFGNKIAGNVKTESFRVGEFSQLSKYRLGEIALNADVDISTSRNSITGTGNISIPFIDFNGYRYSNITANLTNENNNISGELTIDDTNLALQMAGNAVIAGENSTIDATLHLSALDLHDLNLIRKYPGNILSADLTTSLSGNNLSNLAGEVKVENLSFAGGNNNDDIHLSSLTITADQTEDNRELTINSDYFNGSVWGDFNPKDIVPSLRNMVAQALPSLVKAVDSHHSENDNILNFHFTVFPNKEFEEFIHSPVRLAQNIDINGMVNDADNQFSINLNAPYLIKGKSIIEKSNISAKFNDGLQFSASTIYPMKGGKTNANFVASAKDDKVDANFNWKMNRASDYSGELKLSSQFHRSENNALNASVSVIPSQIVFNDTAWNVQQGLIDINDGMIHVYNLHGDCNNQFVHIDGYASKNPADELLVTLNDISLDYIFETLQIDNVKLGGQASGKFFCSDLFSGSPRLETPNLHVNNISYNKTVMGDADIESHWEHADKAVALNADITQHNGLHSFINGKIFTGQDSLYLTFNTQKANVAFMKPFMAAFASDVSGEVSGKAVLFGNFHTIDMYGDIFAENLKLKVAYTNVEYTCTDSVHVVPGYIAFDNVRLSDRENHHATLSGWLKHDAFHDPVFNFAITNADDLLCYDIAPNDFDNWYGTIYGDGSAFISGEPGVVNIKVNMESAPNSKFTFILSKAENAAEYKFITFRDRDKLNNETAQQENDSIPEIIRLLTKHDINVNENAPSNYIIELQMDVNTNTQMTVVMDPVSGDKIRGTGTGHIRLTYDNANEDLGMYGKYSIEKGKYNFTLQDIIIKEFTINEGSSISFQGSPYSAQLDINATYALNANVRDLDESFATDQDMNRTNVPVHAILKANGPMNEPDISFDLQFPTLTSESYRKVKSVISTDDMMNRQIIYLLALNRFYTPEYMNGTTNNNELSSVASSTISSQLSNMLGQLSENWTISPNFRSEKGDFSDVDVNLALSSQLLNNRLLLNGNFGYRDNTYNSKNSNFIGDFDIEYLLNKKGTIRLKAYNHFNDQNYFVRNAMTTQGVGVVFKHSFNRPFDFIKRKTEPSDTTQNAANPQVNE